VPKDGVHGLKDFYPENEVVNFSNISFFSSCLLFTGGLSLV